MNSLFGEGVNPRLTPGAECLLGNGDLLFKDIGQPMRLQSVYLPVDERREVFSPEAVHAL